MTERTMPVEPSAAASKPSAGTFEIKGTTRGRSSPAAAELPPAPAAKPRCHRLPHVKARGSHIWSCRAPGYIGYLVPRRRGRRGRGECDLAWLEREGVTVAPVPSGASLDLAGLSKLSESLSSPAMVLAAMADADPRHVRPPSPPTLVLHMNRPRRRRPTRSASSTSYLPQQWSVGDGGRGDASVVPKPYIGAFARPSSPPGGEQMISAPTSPMPGLALWRIPPTTPDPRSASNGPPTTPPMTSG